MKKVNRQRVYRVQVGIENSDRLQLFLSTSESTVRLMQQMMREGVVDFVFRKETTTELVRRRGTLLPAYIGDYAFSAEQGGYRSPLILTYWDVERGGWRSCLAHNLVGYFERGP